MKRRSRNDGEIIEQPAAQPEGDLACDFAIAREEARPRLLSDLRQEIRELRPLANGVEAVLVPAAWPEVTHYVEVESRCCPFLDLAASRTEGGVVLRVTGRPEALPLIRELFAGSVDDQ